MENNIIREINLKEHKIDAWVVQDTDDDKLLYIVIYCENGNKLEFSFAIDWLENIDPKKTDWLAYVVGADLQSAYIDGLSDQAKKVRRAIKTLMDI